MQHAPAQEHPANLEMSLREHLLAQAGSGSNSSPYPPPPNAGAPGPEHPYQAPDSASPHDQLDPNVAQQQQPPYAQMSGDSGGDEGMSPQGGKGKRELSTSKRAAQNRAAQRAFRQRKEGYIKKLEEQVKEFQTMEQNYRALQNENYQLREYILNLQSRLLETQSDIPPAPSHVAVGSSSAAAGSSSSAAARHTDPQESDRRETETATDSLANELRAAAAQVDAVSHRPPYGLGTPQDYSSKRARGEDAGGAAGDSKISH